MSVRELERESPLSRLRIWRDGESPDGQTLPTEAVVVEWAGRTGHPTSYALLGIATRNSGIELSIPVGSTTYQDSLAGTTDEVTFGTPTEEQIVTIQDVLLRDDSNGWNVKVAALGRFGTSQMAFRWVAGFIRVLFIQEVPMDSTDESLWGIWDEARPW